MKLDKEIEDAKAKISDLKQKANFFNAMQLGLKLALNGSYGAFGNEFFCLSNKDIAGAITAMGRNIIQYMDRVNQEYWYLKWHLDTELHEYLGIEGEVKPIDDTWFVPQTGIDLVLEDWDPRELRNAVIDGSVNRRVRVSEYADTDSLFVSFKPGMDSCGWLADESNDVYEFIKRVSEFRLQPLFAEKLDGYAAKFGVKNIHNFELERINRSIIFLGKKTYVQNVMWEDGVPFDHETGSYLFPKGVQLTKSSTPPFARRKALEIVKYLLVSPNEYSLAKMMALIKDVKRQFQLADIEDISLKVSCNNYDQGVLDDDKHLTFAKGAHFSQKAAGLHNYLLNQYPEHKTQYEFIKSGTKISYYYCKSPLNKMFGYIKGELPHDIAPPVDYDVMFEKIILNQINAFIDALGLPKMNNRLRVVLPLFGADAVQDRIGYGQGDHEEMENDGEEW